MGFTPRSLGVLVSFWGLPSLRLAEACRPSPSADEVMCTLRSISRTWPRMRSEIAGLPNMALPGGYDSMLKARASPHPA